MLTSLHDYARFASLARAGTTMGLTAGGLDEAAAFQRPETKS